MKLSTSDTFEPSGEPVRGEISRLWVSLACVFHTNKIISPISINHQQLLKKSQQPQIQQNFAPKRNLNALNLSQNPTNPFVNKRYLQDFQHTAIFHCHNT